MIGGEDAQGWLCVLLVPPILVPAYTPYSFGGTTAFDLSEYQHQPGW